jgi:hypothetical protein
MSRVLVHEIQKMNLNTTRELIGSTSSCKHDPTISVIEPACLTKPWLLSMAGVKRPARETDRPNTKKLKVLNGTIPRPTRPGTNLSKNVPTQSLEPDGTSTNDGNDSEFAGEEDDEDFKEVLGAGKSNGPSNRTRTDEGAGNTVLNGRCPLLYLHSYVC